MKESGRAETYRSAATGELTLRHLTQFRIERLKQRLGSSFVTIFRRFDET
jgi:hypothetical protein